jgi:hypothetical protein
MYWSLSRRKLPESISGLSHQKCLAMPSNNIYERCHSSRISLSLSLFLSSPLLSLSLYPFGSLAMPFGFLAERAVPVKLQSYTLLTMMQKCRKNGTKKVHGLVTQQKLTYC